MSFRLYPVEQRWWSFQDYQAVLDAMARVYSRLNRPGLPSLSVLEFGPGSSTLALIEGGAGRIDACEDNPDWAGVYQDRLVNRFPEIVRILPYVWADPLLDIPGTAPSYDLALIDGPRETEKRAAVLLYALARCRWVLMPCEEFNTEPWLRAVISDLAGPRAVTFTETGPLAGAFALVGPPC